MDEELANNDPPISNIILGLHLNQRKFYEK